MKPVTNHKELVLLIDDDIGLRDLARHILEAQGFHVVTAGNGQDGLRLFEERQPDIVMLDVMMPDQNGFDVCLALRRPSCVDKRTRIRVAQIGTGARHVRIEP